MEKENSSLRGSLLAADLEEGMRYISFDYKVRFVENGVDAHLLPKEESRVLRSIPSNSVVAGG